VAGVDRRGWHRRCSGHPKRDLVQPNAKEEVGMRQWMAPIAALTLALALGVGMAQADELTGTIQKVDQDAKMFVLEDGTELWVPDGTSLDQLGEGTKVKASYEDKDGKKWVTSIEIVTE
jgi:Cu/Ag efflux protein CusF